MPRAKRQLTWHKPSSRWRKRKTVNGKKRDYYFTFPKNQQGYEAALKVWMLKEAELEIEKNNQLTNHEFDPYVLNRRLLAKAKANDGNFVVSDNLNRDADRMIDLKEQLIKAANAGDIRKAGLIGMQIAEFANSTRRPFCEDDEIDKIAVIKHEQWKSVEVKPLEKQIRNIIHIYLEFKKGTKISPKQWAANRSHLIDFAEFLESFDVVLIDDIKPSYLTNYWSKLAAQEKAGVLAPTTRKRRFTQCRAFLKWAYGEDYTDTLPKNIDSKVFNIKLRAYKPKPLSVDEAKRIIEFTETNSEQTLLYVLLALNCGMLPKDICDLLKAEVNYKKGIITRQRSKTRKHNPHVPIVTYRLWNKTLSLLQKHPSNENSEFAFSNDLGEPLGSCVLEETGDIENDKVIEKNKVAYDFRQVTKKMKLEKGKSFKSLRSTGSTIIESNRNYRGLGDVYLAHTAKSLKDIHYAEYPQELFDEAILWLGDRLGVD